MLIEKELLKQLLKKHVLNVSFIKTDGTSRKMMCSLMEDVLPVNSSKDNTILTKKLDNENTLSVWDIEKSAFRSFRVSSLTEYEIIKEGYEL